MTYNIKTPPKAIIFDLDGTLLNTLQDLANAVNVALTAHNLPKRTLEEVRQFVGNGVRNLMIKAIPQGEKHPEFEEILADFKAHYEAHCQDETKPYEGIMELLEQLKQRNYKMAIVSNKIDSAVKVLAKEYFPNTFASAIGEMPGVEKKPAPDTVFKALRELNVSKEEAIFIGDSDVDVMTAMNAEVECVSVTWGFRDRECLMRHGASIFIDHPSELLELL